MNMVSMSITPEPADTNVGGITSYRNPERRKPRRPINAGYEPAL